MAVANRAFGWDVTVLAVGGTSVLAIFQNCRLSIEVATEYSRATRDTATGGGHRYPREKSRRFTIEIGAVVETIPTLHDLVRTGGTVAIALTGGGLALTGSGTFSGGSLDMPDGPITQGATLTGYGPLAVA